MSGLSHALLVARDEERAAPVADLERGGFTVSLARDDRSALELLRRSVHGFDVLISYTLESAPQREDLVRRVRALRADLPIVVVLEVTAPIERWDEHVHWFARSKGNALAATAMKWIHKSSHFRAARVSSAESSLAGQLPWYRGITPQTVTATEAKNQLPELLEQAAQRGPVIITKHQKPKGVLLGIDEYRALSSTGTRRLATLTEEFDALLARMQEPGMSTRLKAAFEASPDAIGRAAVEAERGR